VRSTSRLPRSQHPRGSPHYRVVHAFDGHAAQKLVAAPQWYPHVVNLDESAFKRLFRYQTVFRTLNAEPLFKLVEGAARTPLSWAFPACAQVCGGHLRPS
jgi:hypothetical protein